jgi:hypothetical protein
MTTPDIIKLYTERGWVFRQGSFPKSWKPGAEIQVIWYARSPRMNGEMILPDSFDEEKLILEESLWYAKQVHGDAIFASFSSQMTEIIRQLAALYRMRDCGKEVSIPAEIVVKDIVVKTTL